MKIQNLIKRKRVIIWGVGAVVLLALGITASNLALNNFSDLIDGVFGGKTAIVDETDPGPTYEHDAKTKAQALKQGNDTTEAICEEGMVLLKNENNALPLKAHAKVSVFGKNSINLVYGGSGSAAPGETDPKTLFDSLKAAGISYNDKLVKFYESKDKSGSGRPANPSMDSGGANTLPTGETPVSAYTQDIQDSYKNYSDAALIVLSRIAGENWDLPRVADDDANKHYLQLDKNESDLIKHVCNSGKFDHVIILFNTSNNIDSGFLKLPSDPDYNDKIDAAIMVGSPGGNGIMALGRILNGTVNPSGHTVDTLYTHYEEDPTWQNFGNNRNGRVGDSYMVDGKEKVHYFVEYEENIYMGYRYYETRGYNDESWYNSHVTYPFGFGLSYTTFSQSLVNKTELESAGLTHNTDFTVKVKVTNTGTVAGKQVVQLYATAPYTNGGIEKAYKVLAGFAKTGMLEPGAEEVVEITVNPYYLASYDSRDKNLNGFKGYELEAGDYVFHVATDAHTDVETFTMNMATGYQYANDPVTNYPVVSQFEEVTAHMGTEKVQNTSRDDFAGTFPTMPTPETRAVTQEFIDQLRVRDPKNPNDYSTQAVPTMNARYEETMVLKELIGVPYDDAKWDRFLDQMSLTEMLDLFNKAMYSTTDIKRLGIPRTTSADGPTGIVAFMGDPSVYGTCYYCSECLVAQTYNIKLAEAEGKSIGEECVIGDTLDKANGGRKGNSNLPYTGWYATGVNIHRSPFGGRNTEYYSEDPLLSGKFASAVVNKVQQYGVYTTVKHFAMNDQETHRSTQGQNYWCDEQAMREIYLKPFEMAVKEGKTKGIMSAFTRIGQQWTGGDYRLLTTILRDEWGFVGTVICDFHTSTYMDSKQMLYAGGDLNLTGTQYLGSSEVSATNAGDVICLRRAAHNTLYVLANSNAMSANILGYIEAPWHKWIYLLDGGLALIGLAWGAAAITTAIVAENKKEKEGASTEAAAE